MTKVNVWEEKNLRLDMQLNTQKSTKNILYFFHKPGAEIRKNTSTSLFILLFHLIIYVLQNI